MFYCTLLNIDKILFYLFQVPDIEVPGYSDVIKNKISFFEIKKKLSSGFYKLANQFDDDVKLIILNCCTFNQSDSFAFQVL